MAAVTICSDFGAQKNKVSHEIERQLLFGRKVMINLDIVLKSRHITLPTKVCLLKDIVFSVVMYEYEGWTIMKAE